MKNRHRRYSRISLKYSQIHNLISEADILLATCFGEKISLWKDDCRLLLHLSLDGKTIWSVCDINVLLEMYLKPGKYYPFTCDACAIPECTGIFAPCHIVHRGDDIILCLRRPLQNNDDRPWRYRAFKLRRKDFLSELLGAMHFRISMENILNIKFDETPAEESFKKHLKLLTDIFGFHDAAEYQYKISQNIRQAYTALENELLKIYGIGS